ncbi:MAG: 3,4-dihydroxy-2-butanone-4-phosphate synthase [Candidatus Thermoplasmatota archaeon]|jgi:3,4-dihydroxy 2-butanone 4-phosphate synthase|nr:3,4-dihydroxy-2-butanone-4-phosphate synthase [Candidatus Thermoplasmatota archaeon]
MTDPDVAAALEAYRKSGPVIVYDADGREEESDLFLPAEACHMEHIRTMRKDGGGLIFLMVRADVRDALGLPFMQELFPKLGREHPLFSVLISDDIPYDTRSSFSVTINHRRTFTGVTDIDRAMTVREFGKLAMAIPSLTPAEALGRFGEHFRTPGHIPICISSDRLLETRFGHTELSCALSTMAGLSGVSVGCEMMGDDGRALPKDRAKDYAMTHGYPFLEGKQIIDAWSSWDGEWKRSYSPRAKGLPKRTASSLGPGQTHIDPPEKKGVRVMATGVFDIMHPGHLHFLQRARELGDELIVVVARDSTVESLKRHPIVNERSRREMVEALSVVDAAYLGYESDHLRMAIELKPDIIALGYDQSYEPDELENELRKKGLKVRVVRMDKRTGDIEGTRQILARIKEGGGSI